MDFFGHQQRAVAASRRLVLWFALAVLGITAAIYFAAILCLVAAGDGRLWQPEVLAVVAAATLAVVGGAALWQTHVLRQGGGAVARQLGGRRLDPDPQDPRERMLQNVVEEMAIAAGMPVPEIYVLDDEAGMNAFAAGWTPADAAIAVTRGLLDHLDRDELQGVIAHEFSHVFHGDMRLNIRLMGVLFGIVCIATVGRVVVRAVGRGAGRGSSKGKGGAAGLLLFGLALVAIGWLGVLFARLIQAAVSRQREFLADASAVQYTRNPRGIAMALARLGGVGSALQSPATEAASHLLFADGLRRFAGGLLATHPPIHERIERIAPGLRGQLGGGGDLTAAVAAAVPTGGAAAGGGTAGPGPAGTSPAALLAAVGAPAPRHVAAAQRLLHDLPLAVTAAAHDRDRAAALALALLLDRLPQRRHAQLQQLQAADAALASEAQAQFLALSGVGADARLAVLELALPALRALPDARRRALRAAARQLALDDGALQPFEFAALRTLERHVRPDAERPPRPAGRPTALASHGAAVACVLSAIAHLGAHGDAAAAARAFARATAALGHGPALALLPADAASLQAMDAAVDALATVSPLGKRSLLDACAEAAAADGTIAAEEAVVLRALAGLWDCPLPLP